MKDFNMKIVLTYGTFDLFHIGHLKLLERCKSFGDKLIVGVSTDDFNSIKGKKTVVSFADRSAIVNSCKYVDYVFAEERWDQKRSDIISHNVDIFIMGDDWIGQFDDLSDLCVVSYLSRTPEISTTEIKNYIRRFSDDKVMNIKKLMKRLNKEISNL
jgi:glycerol-3-phosphate cytidylyltransferase